MRQIDHYIVYLKDDVISHQHEGSHKERWSQLATQVTNDATQPIPRDVLQGHHRGRTVTVTPRTMDYLEIGKKIADVTKLFLRKGSPNQKLAIAATNGLNALVANYARMVMPPAEGRTREEDAINTAIADAARCGDTGTVAYLIAKSLDLPAALVRDEWRDHTYLLLDPESENPVKVDPWTIVSTVCLASESLYPDIEVIESHAPGAAVPQRFNLSSIETIRRRLEEKLGPNAIENAAVEQARIDSGISSPLLDGYLLRQGLMRYDRISTDGMPVGERAAVVAEQRRVRRQVQERQLEGAARQTHERVKTVSVSEPRITRAAGARNMPREDVDLMVSVARQEAEEAAKLAAERAAMRTAKNAAQDQARKDGTTRAREAVVREAVGSATRSAGAITVTVEAKAVAHVEPGIWDERFSAASLNTYRSADGRQIRFDRISVRHLQQIRRSMAAAKRKNFPDAYIKKAPAESHRRSVSLGGGAASPVPNSPAAPITQDRLRQATIDKVYAVLDELRTLQPSAADMGNPAAPVWARQRTLVKMIGDRIEHLPDNLLSYVLRDLARELPAMGHEVQQEAIDLLEVWMISAPDDMSSIQGMISGANSRLISGVTSAQISGKASPQGASSAASTEEDVEQNVEGGTAQKLIGILDRLRAGETGDLEEHEQTLAEGLDNLAEANDSERDTVLKALIECWTAQYGMPDMRDVLQPLVESHVLPVFVVEFLAEAIPTMAERWLRDEAIADLRNYLQDLEGGDELDAAARAVGQCMEQLHQQDKHGFNQWRDLLRAMEPYLTNLSTDTYQAFADVVERVANAERNVYRDNRMWDEYTRVFPEHANDYRDRQGGLSTRR